MNNVEEIILRLKDQFSKSIGKASKNTDKLRGKTDSLQKKLKGVGRTAKRAFAIFAGFQAVKGIARMGIEMEQTRVAFSTFLGDAEKANEVIKELNDFSNVTPFDNAQVVRAGKSLLAFGTPVDKLKDQLKSIGDISAGTGKDFNELTTIYGKAQIAGTLYAEDINQLVEAGIPIISQFAKQLGVNESQVKKLASEGKIGFGNLQQAFKDMTGEGGTFFNLMEKQSKTVGGQISTLKGQLQTVAIALGEAMLPAIQAIISKVKLLTDWITSNKDTIAAWVPTVLKIIGVIGALVIAIKAWVVVQTLINFLMTANPVGVVILAIGALIAIVWALWGQITNLIDNFHNLSGVLKFLLFPLYALFKPIKLLIDNFDLIKEKAATAFDFIKSKAIGLVKILKGVFKAITNPFDAEERKKGFASIKEGVGDFQKSFNDIGQERKEAQQIEDFRERARGRGRGAVKPETQSPKPPSPNGISGIVPSKDKSKAKTGGVNGVSGSGNKDITININKLVESLNLNSTTMKMGMAEMEAQITKVLLTAINNTQIQSS